MSKPGPRSTARQRPAVKPRASAPPRAQAKSRRPQARRSQPSLVRRARRRLPGRGRLLAGLLAGMLVAGFVALLNGPWLRVAQVSWSGEAFTPASELSSRLESMRGASLLTVDSAALASQLDTLPAVASVEIELRIPDALNVRVTEEAPAFVWRTASAQLVLGSDGVVIAELPPDDELGADLRGLPSFDDVRHSSRQLMVGDRIPSETIELGLQLQALDPALLGSEASALSLRLEDEYGYVLVSLDPAWEAAFGFYGLDPSEPASVPDRIERQAAAIRTLFAAESESNVSWVDARNPIKVYFRATDG
jgi:cell division septal protein FtsQ